MKILLVHNSYQQRGGEDVVFSQEHRYLEQAGHKVIIYHRSNSEIDNFATIEKIGLVRDTIWSSSTRRDFAALLVREAPDLVHVHNTFVVISPSIYSACRERGIPVVQTLHNFRLLCPAATFHRNGTVCEDCAAGGLWNAILHGCYHGSRAATTTVALTLAAHRLLGTWHESIDSYIALTHFSRKKFIAAGLNPDKIAVKPNFVAPDPGPRTRISDYALFVGRLSEEKGLATLLEAWERLAVKCPLQIIGDGPDRPMLESWASEHKVSCVTFRGSLSRDETIELVKGARFLVVPSVWYEGFPMVIVEAMACGTPILCSRLGSMEEIVADHVTGLHFTAGEPEDLQHKIEWACNHPSEMLEMGRAARCEYEKRYTADRNYQLLMNIYERALSQASISVAAVSN